MIFRLLAMLLMMAVGGCASRPLSPNEWPASWPTLKTIANGRCPNIDGLYMDIGLSTDPYSMESDMSLSVWLLHYQPSGPSPRTKIKQISNDEIEVEVFNDLGPLKKAVLSRIKGDFDCDGEGLWTRPREETKKDGTGIAHNSISMGFRETDGSALAGQKRNRGVAALLWVIPIVGSQSAWFRWKNLAQ